MSKNESITLNAMKPDGLLNYASLLRSVVTVSVRSIWTYLTASPCYTTNTNTTIPQTNIINMVRQLIDAVSQFLQMCRNSTHRERDRQTNRQTDRDRRTYTHTHRAAPSRSKLTRHER